MLMIYKFGEKHVVFTYGVVKSLESYKQMKKSQHESGGVLLGKVYKDLIIVDRISEPSKKINLVATTLLGMFEKRKKLLKLHGKNLTGKGYTLVSGIHIQKIHQHLQMTIGSY